MKLTIWAQIVIKIMKMLIFLLKIKRLKVYQIKNYKMLEFYSIMIYNKFISWNNSNNKKLISKMNGLLRLAGTVIKIYKIHFKW